VKNMGIMFYGAKALTNLDLSSFDTSQVTDMSSMFENTTSLTSLDVSKFDTSQVTNMNSMFQYLKSVTNLDLSSFDTSQVTEMSSMFLNAAKLTKLDISNFDFSKVTNSVNMFGSTKFQQFTLGPNNKFNGTEQLPNIPSVYDDIFYSGSWQNVGDGTVAKPNGSNVLTSSELMTTYDGATMADTYVWQQKDMKTVAIHVTLPTEAFYWTTEASQHQEITSKEYDITNHSRYPLNVSVSNFEVADPDGNDVSLLGDLFINAKDNDNEVALVSGGKLNAPTNGILGLLMKLSSPLAETNEYQGVPTDTFSFTGTSSPTIDFVNGKARTLETQLYLTFEALDKQGNVFP
jgi:surface protein